MYTLAPIPELLKRQWIKPSKSLDELEQSVCKFLGIKSPEDTPQLSVNFRHSQILEPEYNAKLAWCKRVEQVVSKQSLGKFQTDKLQAAIPSILSYAKREEDVAYIPKLLTSLGIHFAIVPHLSKTYIDGAAFYLGIIPSLLLP